ncbi:MAG TPA: hypothetical protein VGY48_33370 [Vicinamibacterales bacterium]|jgi:hypothetical protein|nr:hypothetical protein [Vicinamibacterales bacterium]
MRSRVAILLLLLSAPVAAQESRLQSDVRREGQDLQASCLSGFDAKKAVGCAVTLATDDPFHVAIGSLSPLNGTGFGLGFAEHVTPNDQWRISFNADGVVATSGSWRAGLYVKFIHIPERPGIVVVRPGDRPSDRPPSVTITEYPVFNLYAQTISLANLVVTSGQDPFSEKQTIAGGRVTYPITQVAALRGLHPEAVGAVNARFLSLHSDAFQLDAQPVFGQFEEGLRITPALFGDRLQFNYLVDAQQFVTSSPTATSFHRWTVDLRHKIPLYSTATSTGPKETNGPDECFQSVGSSQCPPVTYSRNLEGSVGLRLLSVRSGDSVPFYFQPTLGGSDINGERLLAGYDDYRFRGPNLLAFQESIEHSVWGPVGVYALVEEGRITDGGLLGTDGFKNSFAVGLTLRAGGFPLVNISFAWGSDGHHIIGSIDPSLLGGSSRPSLY